MKKSKLNYFFTILLIILILPTVMSLGISPGRTSMDFTPNLKSLSAEAGFTIYNTEKKNMNVALTVEGELKDFITFNEKLTSYTSNDGSKSFSYKVNIPGGDSLTPGLHKAEIVAYELPENVNDPGMVVKATVSVVTQVYVYVFYPGKHLDATLDVVQKEDGMVYLYVPVVSRGNETIESVKAKITIYDSSGNKVKDLETDDSVITPYEKKELFAVWKEPKNGKYKAVAEVNYDGNKINPEKEFSIGDDLTVIGLSVNSFKLGDIAKIKVLVQNQLSQPVSNSYANLKVYDSKLEKIADIKSEVYEIPASSNKEVIIYWDTESLKEGLYDSDLKVNYNDQFLNRKFKVDVKPDSMTFSGVGYVIASESGKKMNTSTFLYIIIGLLLLINVTWLLWWFRNKSKNKNSSNYSTKKPK